MHGRKCILRVVVITAFVWSVAQPVINAQGVLCSSEPTPLEEQDSPETSNPGRVHKTAISLTWVGLLDGGGPDRYGIFILQRGDWLLEGINWVDRSGADAASLLLAGRNLRLGRRLELSLLVGPWYEYANRAWDEAVIDTNFQIHAEQFRLDSLNYWGVPLKGTSEFFDSHTGAVTGIRGLPRWLGANGQVERKTAGITTLWAGPLLTKQGSNLSLDGAPYWDFLRHTAGLRLTVSYQITLKTVRNRGRE